MNRPIYACDRCGAWYTTSRDFAHNDLPWDGLARHVQINLIQRGQSLDFCGKCVQSLTDWFETGKGAEVRPKSLKEKL